MSNNEADLTIDVDERDAGMTVTVVGEIDSSNCDRLQALLSDRASSGHPGTVHVELSGVSFIDSSGLRALLVGQQAIMAASGAMHVTNASDNVRRLFEITGLTERLGTA